MFFLERPYRGHQTELPELSHYEGIRENPWWKPEAITWSIDRDVAWIRMKFGWVYRAT